MHLGFGMYVLVQLEWKKGKGNPFVRGIRSKLRPKSMPLNAVNDRDASSRILLTDPAGSSAEVFTLSSNFLPCNFIFGSPPEFHLYEKEKKKWNFGHRIWAYLLNVCTNNFCFWVEMVWSGASIWRTSGFLEKWKERAVALYEQQGKTANKPSNFQSWHWDL